MRQLVVYIILVAPRRHIRLRQLVIAVAYDIAIELRPDIILRGLLERALRKWIEFIRELSQASKSSNLSVKVRVCIRPQVGMYVTLFQHGKNIRT